jgi:hypothetical protein
VGKLVVLKLGDGSFEQGFSVTLQIGDESARPSTEVTGILPANVEILQTYQQWQLAYRQLGLRSRLSAPSGQVTNVSMREDCNQAAQLLRDSLNRWLTTEPFRVIREKLLEKLSPSNEIRMVLQTKDLQLQRLPWHLWDFFERYPKAEAAFSAPVYDWSGQTWRTNGKVRILAILGNSSGINVQADRVLLEQLSGAEVNFLAEPTRRTLTDQFWQQSWDILFFAGHSSTYVDSETGWIEINATERLSITQLKYALKKGVERGLRVAIFNSCDGLGLAQNLADLCIPQIIVMRDPVPDQIAQEFLKNFLEAFARGESFYLAVREARERLEGLEDEFPCATWLPIIFQNPAEVPPTWKDLCSSKESSSAIFGAADTTARSVSPGKPPSVAQKSGNPISEAPAPSREPISIAPTPKPQPETPPALHPRFLDQCQRELSRYVGPIAQFLLKDALSKHPQSSQQLVEILAARIPNAQQAAEFRQQMGIASTMEQPQPISGAKGTPRSAGMAVAAPQPEVSIPLDPVFLEQCRQELAKSIGPIASHILKTTLNRHPQATPQQLVEILAASIPNSRQAEEFKHTLSSM